MTVKRRTPGTAGSAKSQARREPPQPDAAASDPPYTCSKCRLSTADSTYWFHHRPPRPSAVKGEKDLLYCPNSGPNKCELMDPAGKKAPRLRYTLNVGGRPRHVCSPYVTFRVRVGRDPGRQAHYTGTLVQPPWLLLRILVDDALRERGTRDRVNLDELGLPSPIGFPQGQRLDRASDGRWCLSPPRNDPDDEWGFPVLEEGGLHGDDLARLIAVATALDPNSSMRSRDPSEYNASSIYVPIDLRFSLEEQWKTAANVLGDLQTLMLRLCGRQGAARPDPSLTWRDAYIFTLSERPRLSARQIAAIIFPGEKGADGKVRVILTRVRAALRRAGSP